jgi:hypothetical protein
MVGAVLRVGSVRYSLLIDVWLVTTGMNSASPALWRLDEIAKAITTPE